MLDYEEKNFYQEDEKKYILKKNKEFKSLLTMLEHKGYNHPNLEKLQDYIETVRTWYEFKYPELEFKIDEKLENKDIGVKSISKHMSTEQLLARVDYGVAYLLRGYYKSRGWGLCMIYEDDGSRHSEHEMFMSIKPGTKYGLGNIIHVRHKDGTIIDLGHFRKNSEYIGKTIDELVEKYEEENRTCDLSELKSSIFTHNSDLCIREELIKLAALRLLYSDTTNPVRGYIRANRYITESNRDLGTNVSKHDINEIITRDYNYCRPKEIKPYDSKEIKTKNEEIVKRVLKPR